MAIVDPRGPCREDDGTSLIGLAMLIVVVCLVSTLDPATLNEYNRYLQWISPVIMVVTVIVILLMPIHLDKKGICTFVTVLTFYLAGLVMAVIVAVISVVFDLDLVTEFWIWLLGSLILGFILMILSWRGEGEEYEEERMEEGFV